MPYPNNYKNNFGGFRRALADFGDSSNILGKIGSFLTAFLSHRFFARLHICASSAVSCKFGLKIFKRERFKRGVLKANA